MTTQYIYQFAAAGGAEMKKRIIYVLLYRKYCSESIILILKCRATLSEIKIPM
jgi:hypothetical protein